MFHEDDLVYNHKELIQKLKKLIADARSSETPIFYVQHNEKEGEPLESGTKGCEIHPEIAPDIGDVIIQKFTPDSFFNTNLGEELKKKDIEHLVLAGIQTEMCVDTTCRSAFSKEYDVTLVSDAHSTWNSTEITAQQIINHHNGLLSWFADIVPAKKVTFQ
ncbi:cysteine hydrolase family protein [Falsibacillus albus]|uniref:cysteine hydrolase family protein n=1 Tax=Falsibacillus albus TaxID=2478915 RepID=UPI001F434DDE|nr:cysteine hydrolase family protein [Falsibacillus albus]